MPRLSVWMLRSSLLALLLGTALGAWLLGTEPGYESARAGWRASHLWLLSFGWLVQFVLGVAYWMLPRHATAPERGPAWMAWAAYWAFLLGLGIAVAGWLLRADGIAASGRLVVTAATFCFVFLLWGRVKPFGTR
jgi:heme/copper-type cytochrome/quinol oxidase subunit 1